MLSLVIVVIWCLLGLWGYKTRAKLGVGSAWTSISDKGSRVLGCRKGTGDGDTAGIDRGETNVLRIVLKGTKHTG